MGETSLATSAAGVRRVVLDPVWFGGFYAPLERRRHL